ncbi:MAG: hypothetical protein ABIT04_13080 [Novosphingobium sp.]
MADIVIGSGPAGLAAALARIALGREVIVLDGGKTIDEHADDGTEWSAVARAEWMAPQFAAPAGQVRRYGSDFAMEPPEATFAGGDALGLRSSRAVGGLSNLWGSAMLRWRQSDLVGWPITADDLAPSWRALADHVPMSFQPDALEALFPGPGSSGTALPAGPQVSWLLEALERRPERLAALRVTAGRSRVAVASGCRMCGLCMHGCPWGLIWTARRTIEALARAGRITHRAGAVVRAVGEDGQGAVVHLADGSVLRGERLFVAAGVLETARILMTSEHGPTELMLRESQFAFLPMLHGWRSPRRPDQPPLHTLTQAFVEIDDPAISPFLVHAQLYGWNEFFPRDLKSNYGAKLPGSGPLLEWLARRLIVAQAFLHSDHCVGIRVRRASDGRLLPEVVGNPQTEAVMSRALKQLSAAMRLGGVHALVPAARLAEPGASFHVGASLPMRARPTAGESDPLGRPHGASRIHVVDASVLPAIPATTITWGMMGNAHRIGLAA